MAKGRKTGGRKKGSKNRRTLEREMLIGGETAPLQYMLSVMRDEKAKDERRDDMAKAAAPYVHARRAPENEKGKAMPTVIYYHTNLESDD